MFAEWMPGYDISTARRTAEGFPYVVEEGNFEPGTYGQRSEGRPLIRISPNAQPHELEHEIEHVRQMYRPGGMEALDQGYDENRLTNLYMSYGLTPDEAAGLAYGSRPSEAAARQAAGDPGEIFQRLMQRVNDIKLKRSSRPRTPSQRAPVSRGGGIGGAAARESERRKKGAY
jgi:hypothetical protein